MKKLYAAPAVIQLGSASAETKAGDSVNSDVDPFVQNTSFPPPPPDPEPGPGIS